ncbi:MAG: TLD domain-containing protein [Desulfosporosinus sp.]|nr:TLD domain-containing protein [Desulfosporosinus sp.]
MKGKKNIVKFPDFVVSGTNTDFGVSKNMLYTAGASFRSVLDQSPELASCRVEVPIPDSAVEQVLCIMHGKDVEISNDQVLDCLQLALKWSVETLKDALVARQISLINSSNSAKVLEVGKMYGCKELAEACGGITSATLGMVTASLKTDVAEVRREMDAKLSEAEKAAKLENAKLEERISALEQKLDSVLKLLCKSTTKGEEIKTAKGKTGGNEKWKKSTMMTVDQARLLKEWIKPNELAKVRLILLYRGSRDGYTSGAFHTKCDNVGPTVSVIESHLGKLFGGFTPISWISHATGAYISNDKSFTFSLTSKIRCCMPDSTKYSNAVYHHSAHCSTFGGGHDIYIASECNLMKSGCYANGNSTYQIPSQVVDFKSFYAGAYNFSVKEIEVYQADIIYNYYNK